MIGVIDVGGGLRGIYGAGVLDYCLEHHINFDYCMGISAGSANLASYLGGQKGRNYKFYMEYAFRSQYMSMRNYFLKGSYVDVDYIYGTLSNKNGENPLNYEGVRDSAAVFKIVAMNVRTGKPTYFDKKDIAQDDYHVFKASSCIPVLCKPYPVDGNLYFDGGIIDPIPVKKAFEDGCKKVVIILTRPRDTVRQPDKDAFPASLLSWKFPRAAEKLRMRYKVYNDSIALAKEYEKQGLVKIIAPDDIGGLSTLTKDKTAVEGLYQKGYKDGEQIIEFIGRNE